MLRSHSLLFSGFGRIVFALIAAALLPSASYAQESRPGGVAQQATALLAVRCLSCHNPQAKAGGFDFSTRGGALPVLTPVPDAAVKAGAGGQSRMARAVHSGKMPPTGKLPPQEIALLERWIAAGAGYPHEPLEPLRPAMQPLWSFQPVRSPAVPHSRFDALSANPIDRFVYARLAAKGLKPSPPADRLALLRRVTFDLTGLPPTPAEVEAFQKDKRPDAYARVVDRLLASPAYGERWGRHWLDVVRYGESGGYEQNHLRPSAWPYRDYVIRGFNQDKPYPRFIAEQLAGDALANGDPNIEAATGFLVAGIHDTVGSPEESLTRQQRANDLDDMVSTTGAAFLGLTVGCAKCHDHKFDPIPQRDFYRLAACFAGVRHGERALSPPNPTDARKQEEAKQEEAKIAARMQEIAAQIAALDYDARVTLLRKPTGGRNNGSQDGGKDRSDSGKADIRPSGGASGKAGGRQDVEAEGAANGAFRPLADARWNVDDFPAVAARYVRFTILSTKDGAEPCLDELQVFAPRSGVNLALASRGAKATASSLLPGYAVHQIPHLNDGKFGNEHSWISATRGAGWAQIELPAPAVIGRVIWSRDGGAIPRFDDRVAETYRIAVSPDGQTWTDVASEAGRVKRQLAILSNAILAALAPAQRTERERLVTERAALERRLAAMKSGGAAYIGTFTRPDATYLLRRGNVMQRQKLVSPGALSQIAALNGDWPADITAQDAPEPQRRLALARWIGDAKNPLTARVLVNRLWQHHFGHGLVGSPSDFGRNGERPTHPELLDWLAYHFVEGSGVRDQGSGKSAQTQSKTTRTSPSDPWPLNPDPFACGWSLKKMHRLMLLSATYRQASGANPQGMASDAANQWLWRMPLQRMEAEAVRDSILAVSGKLDRRMGGPSFPLFQYRVVNIAIYAPLEEYGPATWRRSVYQQAARGIRDDLLSNFDCPESSQRAPRRDSATTSLQALSLLNSPFITQQAGFFAQRVGQEAGTNAPAQIRRAFLLAYGRAPDGEEQQAALSLVKSQGMPALCRALLNSNEFLYY